MASSREFLTAYRIVAPRWVSTAFSGEGARRHGGRWNSPGRPVVYLAGSRALAALELLLHLPSPRSRAKPYRILEARIPTRHIRDADRDANPATVGDSWIRQERFLCLRAPSALIPEEPNYLLNPAHPEMARVRVGEAVDFRFDDRL
ncbi:RES family NAD+ phosphorylase [Haloferula sp. A504]|uniref:RES family NAD+ phosphorylase n=1 Tax=Haloferula sp. A504 TaxID=3373601 RepID=UPI0031C76705|nr:RES family NAD+ phosphorylase [Verrucomicrobiaceae bacterium E54]